MGPSDGGLSRLDGLAAWVLTDGKAGDEAPCLGITEALGLVAERRVVRPRRLFTLLMPWGPIDPRERPGRPGSPIAPPFPDLLVGSGRRAVPYLRAVKRASGDRTFTVCLKDPRTGPGAADLIWVADHDALRGANVIASPTAPHRHSAARLAAAREMPDRRLSGLPSPRVAVLVGGDSRHHRFSTDDVARLTRGLDAVAREGASLMATTSRRTPPALVDAVRGVVARHDGYFWDGVSNNPYGAMLALADAVIVTADSTNMVGEAAATGAPIHVFAPSGGHPRVAAFLRALEQRGTVRPFTGRLEPFAPAPLDMTPQIAAAVRRGLERHRAGTR